MILVTCSLQNKTHTQTTNESVIKINFNYSNIKKECILGDWLSNNSFYIRKDSLSCCTCNSGDKRDFF